MSLISWPFEKKSAEPSVIDRILAREGGTRRVITDSGGVTKGGIAETSGRSAEQIRKLTPEQIRGIWGDEWKQTEGIQNPGIREILFDTRGNMGPGSATKLLQRSLSEIAPGSIKVDGLMGATTQQLANSVPQDELAERMMANYKAHHERLVKTNPAKYGPYAKGWANRREALWSSPEVAPLYRVPGPPQPVAPVGPPAPPKPVLVKGTPPPNATVVPPTPSPQIDSGFLAPGFKPEDAKLTDMNGPVKQSSTLALLNLTGFVRSSDTGRLLEAAFTKAATPQSHLALVLKQVDTDPTPAQASAGNYAKGHWKHRGFDFSIENPKGSVRRGVSKSGKAWEVTMGATYGYLKKTEGADGDHVDVFIGPKLASDRVWVIDQQDEKGNFDEHKCVMFCNSEDEARALYLSCYSPGWKVGPMTEMTIDEFKEWLKSDTTKPCSGKHKEAMGLRWPS